MPFAIEQDVVFFADPIKGSRFRAVVRRVDSVDAAQAVLAEVKAADPDATHHAWAWSLREGGVRCGDDGEVSGTAGRPILARLQGAELIDVLVVVTRWYGGTRLGTGGLVRAYGGTAGDALDRAGAAPYRELTELELVLAYSDVDRVCHQLEGAGHELGDRQFGAEVTVLVTSEDADGAMALVTELTGGRARIRRL